MYACMYVCMGPASFALWLWLWVWSWLWIYLLFVDVLFPSLLPSFHPSLPTYSLTYLLTLSMNPSIHPSIHTPWVSSIVLRAFSPLGILGGKWLAGSLASLPGSKAELLLLLLGTGLLSSSCSFGFAFVPVLYVQYVCRKGSSSSD